MPSRNKKKNKKKGGSTGGYGLIDNDSTTAQNWRNQQLERQRELEQQREQEKEDQRNKPERPIRIVLYNAQYDSCSYNGFQDYSEDDFRQRDGVWLQLPGHWEIHEAYWKREHQKGNSGAVIYGKENHDDSPDRIKHHDAMDDDKQQEEQQQHDEDGNTIRHFRFPSLDQYWLQERIRRRPRPQLCWVTYDPLNGGLINSAIVGDGSAVGIAQIVIYNEPYQQEQQELQQTKEDKEDKEGNELANGNDSSIASSTTATNQTLTDHDLTTPTTDSDDIRFRAVVKKFIPFNRVLRYNNCMRRSSLSRLDLTSRTYSNWVECPMAETRECIDNRQPHQEEEHNQEQRHGNVDNGERQQIQTPPSLPPTEKDIRDRCYVWKSGENAQVRYDGINGTFEVHIYGSQGDSYWHEYLIRCCNQVEDGDNDNNNSDHYCWLHLCSEEKLYIRERKWQRPPEWLISTLSQDDMDGIVESYRAKCRETFDSDF